MLPELRHGFYLLSFYTFKIHQHEKEKKLCKGGKILKDFTDDCLMRTGNMTTRLINTGKHYLNKGRACLSEGNIFGENEEDYFSHAVNA